MDISQADSVIGNEQPVPPIASEEMRPWSMKMMTLYTLANFGASIALITPIAISLSLRVAQIDPVHKTADYGLIIGAGSLAHLVVGPIAGIISDRTTSRFGRRRPWITFGMVAGFLSLLLIAVSNSIPLVLLGWILTQFTFAIISSTMNAMMPDQVPAKQLGRLSALVGVVQTLSTFVGVLIASLLISKSTFLVFMIPAAIALVTVLALAFTMSDRPIGKEDLEPFPVKDFLKTFWVNPHRYPDFGWAWLSQFLVTMALSFYSTYATYFVLDRLHYTVAGAAQIQLILFPLGLIAIPFAIGSGILSDKWGRRKIFVIVSTLVAAVGMGTIAFVHSLVPYIIGSALVGIALATYSAVGQALTVQVLPKKEQAGKDMGVYSLAAFLPKSIAPIIAPLLLAIGGGSNYTVFYLIAGVICVIGALVIQPIKGVR